MGFKKGQNFNHPRKGSSIKVDPIRDRQAIARIKYNLEQTHQYRDLCLFTLGINTAWRCGELMSFRVGDVEHLRDYDMLELKQSKNQKYRMTPLNPEARKAVQKWLMLYKREFPAYYSPHAPLFMSTKCRRSPLLVSSVCNMVKRWGREVGVSTPIGSHTLRKTWGYQQRVTYNAPVSLIREAYGHSSEEETLAYIGILPEEVNDLYKNEI